MKANPPLASQPRLALGSVGGGRSAFTKRLLRFRGAALMDSPGLGVPSGCSGPSQHRGWVCELRFSSPLPAELSHKPRRLTEVTAESTISVSRLRSSVICSWKLSEPPKVGTADTCRGAVHRCLPTRLHCQHCSGNLMFLLPCISCLT